MAPYPWKMAAMFALVFVMILVAGVLFYTSEEQQLQKQVINDLTSIAKLKAGQIASWREDRL